MKLLALLGAGAMAAGTMVAAAPAEAQYYRGHHAYRAYHHYPRYGYGYRHHPAWHPYRARYGYGYRHGYRHRW